MPRWKRRGAVWSSRSANSKFSVEIVKERSRLLTASNSFFIVFPAFFLAAIDPQDLSWRDDKKPNSYQLLHLDTHVKFVQYIKLATRECGLGMERVRSPRLPISGRESMEVVEVNREGSETRPEIPKRHRP